MTLKFENRVVQYKRLISFSTETMTLLEYFEDDERNNTARSPVLLKLQSDGEDEQSQEGGHSGHSMHKSEHI